MKNDKSVRNSELVFSGIFFTGIFIFFMFFYNPSVRTRQSFECAATELGGHAQFLEPGAMRLKTAKTSGETIEDAAKVMAQMEFAHQALFPDLDVTYVSVTEQWAQMAVAGPKSRPTLQKIVDDLVMTDETVPYMAAKEVTVLGGVPARLFRISFSGEHAYELAVPADYGNMAARAIYQAGQEFGIVPYGVEALSIMRVEKGHVAGGELNGTTTAGDLGLGKMMSAKKDYIGRMMATREGLTDPHRPCVVGIRPVDPGDRILECFVGGNDQSQPGRRVRAGFQRIISGNSRSSRRADQRRSNG